MVFVVLLCNKLWLDCKLFLQIIDLESQGRDLIILVSKTLKGTICNELSIDLCISALPSSSETRVNRFQSTLEIHSFLFFDGSSRLKLADLGFVGLQERFERGDLPVFVFTSCVLVDKISILLLQGLRRS